jgi:sugar-specific transcriptional regulator TrmB
MAKGITKAEQTELNEVLSDFGLKEKDRQIYLAMLPMGVTSLTPLAQKTGLKITTVQAVITRLSDKGLIKISKRKSRSVFEAINPSDIKRILERRQEELTNIIPILQKLQSSPAQESKIRIYFRERATEIFHEALNTQNKLIYEIISARDFQQIIGEKFHFTKRRIKKNIKLKSLRVENREIKKYSQADHAKELREAKFLPRELTFHNSIMCWDDKVAFFTTKEEGLAWVVQSTSLAESIRQLFHLLWEISRKMETA